MSRILEHVRALLILPSTLHEELRSVERTFQNALKETFDRVSKRQDGEYRALQADIVALRDEMHDRLLQYHLQLARLAALLEGRNGEPAVWGGRIPVNMPDPPAPAASQARPSEASSDEWLRLERCPACGTTERTVVCEWNKLVLLDTAPDERASHYDYAVCHGCGILYASGRPFGGRYRYLVEHFEDVIDKNAASPLLNPNPLTEEDRERYRRLIARGVFVSDHEGGQYLKGVFTDRLENASHVDLLGSLLDLRGARALEVRPRAGTILEGLRRLYGVEVHAMPMWESQQFILRELYGINCSSLIDFDEFSIPFEAPFDLIVCNHMFNHAVRLDAFLAAIRAKLRPGGHLYLYNEIDDSEFLEGGQSMIATMNPLHLQATDRMSLVRALGASGFEVVFVKGRNKRNFCLARSVDRPAWTPIAPEQRDARIAAYRRARDRAVLRAPEQIRPRFAADWPATVERAVATGIARFDETGALRLVKGS
jgi:SAM-dependent methyltransferase